MRRRNSRSSCLHWLGCFALFYLWLIPCAGQTPPVLVFSADGGLGPDEGGPPVHAIPTNVCFASVANPVAPALLTGPLPTPCTIESSFNQTATVASDNPAFTFGFMQASGSESLLFAKATASIGGVSGGASLFQDDIPAPAGLTITLSFPVTISNVGAVTAVASSDSGPGRSRVSVTSVIDATGTLTLPPLQIGLSGTYSLSLSAAAIANVNGTSPVVSTAKVGRCAVTVEVLGNGKRTMQAVARPPLDLTLTTAADACGFIGFDWQQTITKAPCPNSVKAARPRNGKFSPDNFCPKGSPTPGSLTAPPECSDPAPGGYTYLTTLFGDPYDPSPYYFPVDVATSPDMKLPLSIFSGGLFLVNNGDVELKFLDRPTDSCLPTGPLNRRQQRDIMEDRARNCGGPHSTAPKGSFLEFRTALVGVGRDAKHTPSDPLFEWTWRDTFNGTVGKINTFSPSGPIDPGSGAGFITITSINGIPVPPVIPPSQIATKLSRLDPGMNQTFAAVVTIKNISDSPITTASSFQLAFNSLPAGVTVSNATGMFNEGPYITVPAVTSLGPGESTEVSVQFQSPSAERIKFTPEVYAGAFQ